MNKIAERSAKKINGFLMLCVLLVSSFFFYTSVLFANDYFVSPSGNNTTGDGTIGNPWQTIEYAINNIYPGDILYLRGGIYNEQVTSVRSGAANAYITISSYNNENAIIDGTGLTWNNGLIIEHSYIKLIGFTSRTWGSTGIWIRDCQFIELRKLKITDVIGGISVTGTVHDFVVDSCIIYDFYGGAGGLGFDATPGEGDSIYNGVISNSKAYIAAGGFDNCDGFALGHDGVSNIYFYNCEVYGVGDGFDISGRDIILERCLAHDCTYGGGYKLWRDSVTLINCIGYNNRTNLELDFDQGTNKGVKARLINCTFWGPGADGSNIFIEYSELGSKLEMFNCILAGSNNTGLTFGDTDSANCYTGDYNLFHGINPFRVISGSTFDFTSTQILNGEWTVFSGQDANSQVVFDASVLFIDTLLTNPNLHLIPAALAIDNGTMLPDAPSFDFDNCPRNVGQIDIGAYEYGACGVGILNEDFNSSYSYYIDQNYPNPFNPTTQISFAIPTQELVTIKVFDVLGRQVEVLMNESKAPGYYSVNFNGGRLPSGTYMYEIRAGNFVETKKMMLLK